MQTLLTGTTRQCSNDRCNKQFTTHHESTQYCSLACKQSAAARRRREKDRAARLQEEQKDA